MSWKTNISQYKFNNTCISNIKQFQELLKKNNLTELIEIKNIKKKKSEEHWKDTLVISKTLLKLIDITMRDQYYFKILRILRYCLFDKIIKSPFIIRSKNKQLRYDYKYGENNIIGAFVENISLKDGVWIPKGQEHLISKIIKDNIKKIKQNV
jgi:hypothetical protein